MRVLHDTGYGVIELTGDMPGLWRMRKPFPRLSLIMQVGVRTWKEYGKVDSKGTAIPADNIRCILQINEALELLKKQAPPAILIINLDEPSKVFKKLDSSWLQFKTAAICKTDTLDEATYLNFLEEYFNAVQ